jgi:hypothetical protein
MTNRNLSDILKPNYGDDVGEVGIAPVKNDAGSEVSFNATSRKVKNNVRINIGNSPNSNTGDPLRTAFIKIGNFMEAVYATDSDKDRRLARLERPTGDSDFRILGVKSSAQIQWDSDETYTKRGVSGGIDSDAFKNLSEGDVVILSTNVPSQSRQSFRDNYARSNPAGRIDINTVNVRNGEYGITAPAYLRVGSDGLLKVENEFTPQNLRLDFDGALSRLQAGTQTSKLSAADQRTLYSDFNNTQGDTASSFRISADNVEDAFAEMMARLVRVGYDAGYYG